MSTSFSAAVSGDVTAMLKHLSRPGVRARLQTNCRQVSKAHQLRLDGANVRREQLLHLWLREERAPRELRSAAQVGQPTVRSLLAQMRAF